MSEQPEVRVERGPVTQNEAFAIGMAKLLEREGKTIAAAELRRLHEVEQQRNELLAALQRIAGYDLPDEAAIVEVARAAIAKAEGEK